MAMGYADSMLIVSRPDILAKRLSYVLFSDEKFMQGLTFGKTDMTVINGLRRNYTESHELFSSIAGWWHGVIDIPKRRLGIVLPLHDMLNLGEYDDSYRIFYDPLAPVRADVSIYAEMLKELGIAEHTYIVFLDALYFPFVVQPEKYKGKTRNEDNTECIPEALRPYYKKHVVRSNVFEIKDVRERTKALILIKQAAHMPLSEAESLLLEDPDKFDKTMKRSLRVCKKMLAHQLSNLHFCDGWVGFGYVKDFDYFCALEPAPPHDVNEKQLVLPGDFIGVLDGVPYAAQERILERGITSRVQKLRDYLMEWRRKI